MTQHSTPARGLMSTPRSELFEGRFGRIFRALPPATYGPRDEVSEANLALLATAMKGGDDPPKDGKDDEESAIPALYTYFGQFIDHDLTFDPSSSLQKQNDPNALTDFRTPAFDLDCIYGRGPDDQPYMYGVNNEFLFGPALTGASPTAADLARGANGRALIGDPRNDENTIVSQLQGLFQRFHNRVLHETGAPFGEVQRLVRFHYQYVILNDFLPRIIDANVLADLKSGDGFDQHKLNFYHFRHSPFMPVEFSAACYRFGHSMVRPGYRLNDSDSTLLPIFPDLVGFEPVEQGRAVDWGRFVDTDIRDYDGDVAVQKKRLQLAYRIDTSIVEPLSNLPLTVAPTGPHSLAERNLKRGFRLALPNGQSVARAMHLHPLHDEQILIGTAVDAPNPPNINIRQIPGVDSKVFKNNCPLWTYILAEAMQNRAKVKAPVAGDVLINTPRLGPVGGRIIAEVFLGLMFGDNASLLSLDRHWHPAGGPHYTLKDFVNYALGN